MGDAVLVGEAKVEPSAGLIKTVPWRNDALAAAVCVAFGVLMSMMPYALWWPRLGEPVWLADYDEVFYLQIAGQAYFHHPTRLGDPMVTGPETRSAFPSVVLCPGVVAAKLLGLGPLAISFFWRLGAGVGVGAFTYLLIRHFLGRPLVSMALACLLMADVGMLSAQPVIRQWRVAAEFLAGRAGALLATNPRLHVEWRVVNPGPSLPFLLLHVLLVARARDRPTPLRLALAGAGFGLLFYVYFYYYTVTCLALVLATALDAGRRRVYFHTLWIGGLIGLPGVVGTYLFKRSTCPDWLPRTDKFLAIPHFSQLMIPWVACGLLAVGLTWVALRRRELAYVGLLGLSGVCLANHQIVTGLQIENFHWHFVWAPMTCYLALILAAGALEGLVSGSKRAVAVLLALWAVHLGVGVWLRAVEVTKTREPVELAADYLRYRDDRRLAGGSAALAPDSVIAGDPQFVHFATIVEDQRPLSGYVAQLSPYVDNASWNERVALNAYLRGLDVSEFEAEQRRELEAGHWGPWGRDPAEREAMIARRRAAFVAVAEDSRPALSRYDVRYIALPAGRALPASIRPRWKRIRAGATWDVLVRDGDGGGSPPPSVAPQPM